MEIKRTENDHKGTFTAYIDGEQAGLMTYTWAGKTQFIIDHTEADSKFSGKGVGKSMVLSAVEFAREKGVKIIPLCPFAKAVLEKNKDLHDVL
jgi:predicted GNAT family acetyltransferase